MALKGQLHDFNLSEILQLIATQQKSGFLVLEGHREMVFVFDKGVLISVRDRRSESSDPLEDYLRNYGFFSDSQWSHVSYVRANSSLDLAEILLSEEMLDRDQLDRVLAGVAREMGHRGMKMRRGRYNFTATKDTPPGVRWRMEMDVQGLLMEAARRVDEEQELVRVLPNQSMTFAKGSVPPSPDALSETGRRIIKLALGGRPLGRIISLARTDSFTSRELLKTFLDEGWLTAVMPDVDDDTHVEGKHDEAGSRRTSGLRQPLLSMLVLVVMLAFGGFRWAPLMLGEMALVGLAEPVSDAAMEGVVSDGVSWLDDEQLACRRLRLRQIHAQVGEAAQQYREEHGDYPANLDGLVQAGMLAPATEAVVDRLGWQYALLDQGEGFSLGR